ncbi:hypothetical protein GE061_010079 [Apolygus lucorum]|uniref:Reverse transcriptase domain-containing protein n=1 Tax=Apolygus lucorum TaxID=248454 RepID=A0A8S9Y284_APOLU|nr:hypothetical protein GE061_010079 [Apolygus lucorum]
MMPWGPIYKAAAGKQRTPLEVTTVKRTDGTLTDGLCDTLTLIMDTCVPSEEVPPTSFHEGIRTQAENYAGEIDDVPFAIQEVRAVVKEFESGKSPGEDGFTSEILAGVFGILPGSLTFIFSRCLGEGIFPNRWKKSDIVLTTKPGKKGSMDPSKYRPISLLPIMAKTLEKLMINRIMYDLRKRGKLSERQYGFIPQKSTIDALKAVRDAARGCLDRKEYGAMVSLDVRGAFNGAWWPAILKRLAEMGCPERWAWESNLQFNPEKTQVLRIGRRQIQRELAVYLLGSRLALVSELRYLGVYFESSLRWNSHVAYICKKATQLINVLARSAKMYWGLGSEALRVIYRGAIVPIMTYAITVWVDALDVWRNVAALRRVQRLMLLRIIKGVRTISYDACCVIAGERPIEMEAREIANIQKTMAEGEQVDRPLPPVDWPHPARIIDVEKAFEGDADPTYAVYTDGNAGRP